MMEAISIAKEVLVSIAAATTAIVAVLGLRSWSRELRGRTQFEVARQLIRATYRVRDELRYCRTPFIQGAEFPADYPAVEGATPEQEAKAWAHIYQNRWEPVRDALRELDAQLLEAEALWGSDIRKAGDALRLCARELQVAMEAIIDDKAVGGQNFQSDRDFAKKMRSTAHASATSQDNELTNKIQDAVSSIERHVRPHLHSR
ncbi:MULTISPECIES: hypothetical protein [Chromohalobacter]|uniref:hypothetical protein n=1 Tax=Chromohalobacter TaxID=42054 RepID=UPI001FFCB607|nr:MULTISPECIES: hypothetical protein [Chromohalobacter]MCK2045595.1 hypothetical protein [Chromohalobacter moromii]MCT8468332.1 hypothetical protein [Chromohalobacter canadensis]MCT8471387.1 hypothetical protein [Chromohalobacter canadensis]MCT8498840.1 hypothetical protein [Chromohalobacter canadensis]